MDTPPHERQCADVFAERKVRCDSKSPKCGNCTKARRVCKGYGIQLSWPRDGDAKRAMISRDTTVNTGIRQSHASRFLNSSSWDVSLSEELESGRSSSEYYLDIVAVCLMLTVVTYSALPPNHASPSPNLPITHGYQPRRITFTRIL